MRPRGTSASTRRVRAELERRGWLLQADFELPSVTTLVAGEAIRGSWWGHPRGNHIYWVLQDLEDDGDTLWVKLANAKVTLVHRRLWPALLAVAQASAGWQTRGLSTAARALLRRTRRAGRLRLDELQRWSYADKPGVAARELERRLLVGSDEVHTDSGRHAKVLESWPHLCARLGVEADLPSTEDAMNELEASFGEHRGVLPWQARGRSRGP